jgi:hypothetical protein
MAKARKRKTRKPAKRASKKRATTAKLKARKVRRAKSRKPGSLADAVHEAAELRRRLAGHNTFED